MKRRVPFRGTIEFDSLPENEFTRPCSGTASKVQLPPRPMLRRYIDVMLGFLTPEARERYLASVTDPQQQTWTSFTLMGRPKFNQPPKKGGNIALFGARFTLRLLWRYQAVGAENSTPMTFILKEYLDRPGSSKTYAFTYDLMKITDAKEVS